jgi:glyceraldehyde 3-phosphate dehydrogenase
MTRVAINGLGRIGRATLKILLDQADWEVVAVNDLVPPENLAYLLRYDTVYGRYKRPVKAAEGRLTIDRKTYKTLAEKDPAKLPWTDLGVELVFECTGVFRKREDLEKHLQAGAQTVFLSAPAKGDDIQTVVHGVNELPEPAPQIVSCASCTTNCVAPVVEVMGRRIGVRKATMTTIHAYTASQALVDGPHKRMRRGRAGAANLVPTSTGAALATTKTLPQYEGLFDGVAVRAPLPVGSVADLVFLTERRTSVDEVNNAFREEAGTERYTGILGATDDPLVSTDIVGDPRASVVDLEMTQVVDGDLVKVMSWYDNEWGYANQMVKLAATAHRMAK